MTDEDDRRHDTPTRDRFDALSDKVTEALAAQDQKYRRVTKFLTGIALTTLVACSIGYGLIQGQRYDSIVQTCKARNQQAMATVGLLRDLHVHQPVIDIALKRFPTEKDCHDYAAQQVTWFRL